MKITKKITFLLFSLIIVLGSSVFGLRDLANSLPEHRLKLISCSLLLASLLVLLVYLGCLLKMVLRSLKRTSMIRLVLSSRIVVPSLSTRLRHAFRQSFISSCKDSLIIPINSPASRLLRLRPRSQQDSTQVKR